MMLPPPPMTLQLVTAIPPDPLVTSVPSTVASVCAGTMSWAGNATSVPQEHTVLDLMAARPVTVTALDQRTRPAIK